MRARLLLAGPGRQDLTGEFGLDVTVPGYHSARYAGTARVRQRTRGLVNPISVPTILAAPGLALENWSGSEAADAPWLERLLALGGAAPRPTATAERWIAGPSGARCSSTCATWGRWASSRIRSPGCSGPTRSTGTPRCHRPRSRAIPKMYAATSVRAVLADGFARPPGDAAAIARGREIFSERVVGAIANRQILKLPPPAYAAAKLEGPILAPIDPTRPLEAKLAVRCADCHAGAPLENRLPLATNPPPLGRCSHCHLAHSRLDEWATLRAPSLDAALVPVSALPLGRQPADEVAFCEGCHSQHRDFGPLVYSSGRLFPFDADGDGDAQQNPAADRRAGGIGTDPWLAFDVPRAEWPFAIEVATISNPTRAGHVGQARIGAAWVRAAPLVGLAASAPYLHNGSVPSLRALLDPPSKRPVTFPLGKAGFVFDTRLPGNGNQGHDFGSALTAAEKSDLVAFLESL